MWQSLSQYVEQKLHSNQFFSGGLVLMVAGAVVAYLRHWPQRIWHWVKSRFMIEVDILDRDAAFDWLDQWLAQHHYTRTRARWLSVTTRALDYRERQADPTGDHRPRLHFSPAPGRHLFFYRRRLVILVRERPEANQTTQQPVNVREKFSLTIFTRDRSIVRQLLEEAREIALPVTERRLTIYRTAYNSWSEQLLRYPRDPASVVLRAGQIEALIGESRWFLEQRQWYLERGIPYRRGYLLYGPPGTGKSSTVVAIASALRMDIAMLNLGSGSLDDNELGALLADLPVNTVLLIEDIDCVFHERKATEDKTNRVTFSGLLNALDGVASAEGRILFATTNHRERLDPALIRPGRIDGQIEIGFADRDQLRRMFQRFYTDADPALAEEFAELVPDKTVAMSAVQSYLIQHAESPRAALAECEDWLAELPFAKEDSAREWAEANPL